MPFYLQFNQAPAQRILSSQLPLRIGRSLDCDISIHDQTVAPVQVVIDQDEAGNLTIENKAEHRDNPTKIQGRRLKQKCIVSTPTKISMGRVQLQLSCSEDALEKTVQLRPSGLLGVLALPLCSLVLATLLLWLNIFELKLNTIKPFEHEFSRYAEWMTSFMMLLAYSVFVHVSRARMMLLTLSITVISIGLIGFRLLPFAVSNMEYALDWNSDGLLGTAASLLFFFALWYFALRLQLHTNWHRSTAHAALVTLPVFLTMLSSSAQSTLFDTKSIRGNLNGTVEAYNLHIKPTQSLETYFAKAHKTFNSTNTPVVTVPFTQPSEIEPEQQQGKQSKD